MRFLVRGKKADEAAVRANIDFNGESNVEDDRIPGDGRKDMGISTHPDVLFTGGALRFRDLGPEVRRRLLGHG